MNEVTVSPEFQIVIPRNLREAMDIQPGARIQVLRYADRIELIPLKNHSIFAGSSRGSIPAWTGSQTGYEPRRFLWLARILCR